MHSLTPGPAAWTAVQSFRVRPSRLHDPRHALASTPFPVLSAGPESTCSQCASLHAARLPSAPSQAPDPRRAQAPIPHPCSAPGRTALACSASRPAAWARLPSAQLPTPLIRTARAARVQKGVVKGTPVFCIHPGLKSCALTARLASQLEINVPRAPFIQCQGARMCR